MNNPPKYLYPLYKPQDRELYELLNEAIKKDIFPEIGGNNTELVKFIKSLIASQKMRDYRKFWDELIASYKQNKLELTSLNAFASSLEIKKGIDESWAVFQQDKDLCLEIDKVFDADIILSSSDNASEFITHFLLSQLSFDWRGPLMATCMEITETNTLDFTNLIQKLESFKFKA